MFCAGGVSQLCKVLASHWAARSSASEVREHRLCQLPQQLQLTDLRAAVPRTLLRGRAAFSVPPAAVPPQTPNAELGRATSPPPSPARANDAAAAPQIRVSAQQAAVTDSPLQSAQMPATLPTKKQTALPLITPSSQGRKIADCRANTQSEQIDAMDTACK